VVREPWLNIGLFLASCVTTYLVGGPYFAGTLMGILACHEAGHYFTGLRRGVDVSLPFFIPLPPGISLGTLGAVIRMKKPIHERNTLFDVGASGPIAGLVVAIPLLVIGLHLSQLGPINATDSLEGNSILYALLKYAVFGRWLPGDGIDVQLHPMALAAWVGLLVTAINLMPIGQLDGGHIARAALGDRHETWSARLNLALPVLGLAIGAVMYEAARGAGKTVGDALLYAKDGVIPWMIWAVLLGLMRRSAGEYHPPVGETPLDRKRRILAVVMLVIFILIVTPVPFRSAL
jgi:membrane-associated protease RseP (regulator of RpoE activity)